MLLRLGEQRYLANRLVWVSDDAFEQDLKMTEHALDGGGIEQIGIVVERGASEPCLSDMVSERSNLAMLLEDTNRNGAKSFKLQGRIAGVLECKHHLEQRRDAGVALGM